MDKENGVCYSPTKISEILTHHSKVDLETTVLMQEASHNRSRRTRCCVHELSRTGQPAEKADEARLGLGGSGETGAWQLEVTGILLGVMTVAQICEYSKPLHSTL